MKKRKAAIAPLLTLAVLALIGITAIVSSFQLGNKQSSSSRAAEVCDAGSKTSFSCAGRASNECLLDTIQAHDAYSGLDKTYNKYLTCCGDGFWHVSQEKPSGCAAGSPAAAAAAASASAAASSGGDNTGVKTGYGNCTAVGSVGKCVYRSYAAVDPHYFNQWIKCGTDGSWYAKDINSQDPAKGWQNQTDCEKVGSSTATAAAVAATAAPARPAAPGGPVTAACTKISCQNASYSSYSSFTCATKNSKEYFKKGETTYSDEQCKTSIMESKLSDFCCSDENKCTPKDCPSSAYSKCSNKSYFEKNSKAYSNYNCDKEKEIANKDTYCCTSTTPCTTSKSDVTIPRDDKPHCIKGDESKLAICYKDPTSLDPVKAVESICSTGTKCQSKAGEEDRCVEAKCGGKDELVCSSAPYCNSGFVPETVDPKGNPSPGSLCKAESPTRPGTPVTCGHQGEPVCRTTPACVSPLAPAVDDKTGGLICIGKCEPNNGICWAGIHESSAILPFSCGGSDRCHATVEYIARIAVNEAWYDCDPTFFGSRKSWCLEQVAAGKAIRYADNSLVSCSRCSWELLSKRMSCWDCKSAVK